MYNHTTEETDMPRTPKPINFPAPKAGDFKSPRAGSKTEALIKLLTKKDGTTLDAIAKALSKSGSEVSPAYARSWVTAAYLAPYGIGVRSEETDNGVKLFAVTAEQKKAKAA